MQGGKGSRVEKDPLFWNYCKYMYRLQLLPFSSEQFYLPASYKTHLKTQKHGNKTQSVFFA
jgi:hypothetical protein